MVTDTLAVESDGDAGLELMERRAYPRFKVSLAGVCAVEGGEDAACDALDVSLGGIALRAKTVAFLGQAATVSLPQIGLVRGHVTRAWPDGFALRFEDSAAQRRRIVNYLTWLVAREAEEDKRPEDRRSSERLVPLRRLVTLTTRAGATCMARIVDISRSGAAVTTTAAAALGDAVRLDSTEAIVARLFDGGIAARFTREIDGDFDATIRL